VNDFLLCVQGKISEEMVVHIACEHLHVLHLDHLDYQIYIFK